MFFVTKRPPAETSTRRPVPSREKKSASFSLAMTMPLPPGAGSAWKKRAGEVVEVVLRV